MRLVLALLLSLAPLVAQEAAPEPQAPAQSEEQDWLQKEVGLEQMFRNPSDRFASLLFNRLGTVKVNGVDKVRYSVSSAGLEPGKHYLFMAWELGADAPVLLLPSVQVDEKGVLHCDPENKDCPGGPGSEVNVAVSDTPGQPSRFVIADPDEKPIALGEVIPNPSSVTDHDCTLETVLLRPDATIALVVGHGFDPGEDVKVISTSFDEHVSNSGKADEHGAYQTVLLPISKAHDAGETMVTMNSSQCELSTQYAWGAAPPLPAETPETQEVAKEAPAQAAPPQKSETVVAPVRTATDQIQRAIAEQAAKDEAAKEQPQLHAGPKPPDESSPEATKPEEGPTPGPESEAVPAETDSAPKATEPSPEAQPAAPTEEADPKSEPSEPSPDNAATPEAPVAPPNPPAEPQPEAKPAPDSEKAAPSPDQVAPPPEEASPKEPEPSSPPPEKSAEPQDPSSDAAEPKDSQAPEPTPPPAKPDAPEQTPQA